MSMYRMDLGPISNDVTCNKGVCYTCTMFMYYVCSHNIMDTGMIKGYIIVCHFLLRLLSLMPATSIKLVLDPCTVPAVRTISFVQIWQKSIILYAVCDFIFILIFG